MAMIELFIFPTVVQTALAWVNLGLCALIVWSCLCRITLMDARTTRVRFRLGYSLLMVAATSSGASPVLWGELPGPGQISMALAILYVIGAGYGSWRQGIPDYATRPGALMELTRK
jgi:hypothetical protein